MKKFDLLFNVIRVPADFGMVVLAGITTYIFRTEILSIFRPVLFEFQLPLNRYISLVVFSAFLFIAAYSISGLYSMKKRMSIAEEFAKILIASSAGTLSIIIFIFLRQELFDSRFLVIGGWSFVILFVFSGRLMIRATQRYAIGRYNYGVHRVLIIGGDTVSEKIATALSQNPALGCFLIGHLLNPTIDELKEILKNSGIDEVILANPNYPAEKIVELVDFCHEHHLAFKFVPNIYQTFSTHYDVDSIANVPIIELKRTALDGWGKVFKRIVDILFSFFALIFFLPLFAICAFAIKWETAGPVFVRLKRISKNKEFFIYKFRSMIENAEELKQYLIKLNERNDGPLFKMKNDPRITGVGKFLRKYRIDELPQFFNVLMGDISLVGPRPHQPDEVARYTKGHKKVLAIQAGATGLAQVSGSSDLSFEEEVVIDTFYIENWSLWIDMKIIAKTILKILRDRSAV